MAKQRSFGDTGTGPCTCRVSRGTMPGREDSGCGRRGGQWVLDSEGTPRQESGQHRAPGSLPTSSPIPSRQGHPQLPPALAARTPLGCDSSTGAAAAGGGASARAQRSPQTHPCSAHPALPRRHKEGVGLCPHAQECLGKSTVTQGRSGGPGAVTRMGDPQGEEPSALRPRAASLSGPANKGLSPCEQLGTNVRNTPTSLPQTPSLS